LTALLECIYEADQAAEVLDASVHMLEDAYKTKNWQEALGGVIGTVSFVKDLQAAVPTCKSIKDTPQDWNEFNKIFKAMLDPKNHIAVIGKNIVFHHKTITNEIQ
jgi:hypothetical protein